MIWLLLAIGLSALFVWIATWASRRPRSLNHGIREFSRGLEALAPPEDRGGHVRPLRPEGEEPPEGPGEDGDHTGDYDDLDDLDEGPSVAGGGR